MPVKIPVEGHSGAAGKYHTKQNENKHMPVTTHVIAYLFQWCVEVIQAHYPQEKTDQREGQREDGM